MDTADLELTLYPTPGGLRRINREFVAYVRANYPMRFYGGEPWWTLYSAAALLRMCDTIDSMMLLLPRRKDGDAQILLRSLYEQTVILGWIAIDPERRHERWEGEGKRELLKLHNEALPYGETILSQAEVAACQAATGLPKVEAMTRELDGYWPTRVRGLHVASHLLSFHGMYQGVYRVGSRPAHGSLQALEPYVHLEPCPPRVSEAQRDTSLLAYALAAPLFGIALLIAAQRFRWIDEDRVMRFVDRATAETIRRRQRR